MVQALADGIRVREEPGLDATQVARLSAGQRARVVGGPRAADSYQWFQVSLLPSGVSGWVAAGNGVTPWIAEVLNGRITWASGRDVGTLDENGNRGSFAQLDEGWNAEEFSWAPDGLALAIAENRQEIGLQSSCVIEGRIAILDDTGRVIARSSPSPGTYDTGPAWSPDGSHIAYTRVPHTCASENHSGSDDLFIMDASGGNQRLVVANVVSAVWSPTGGTFAYLRFNPEPTGGWEIWMIGADGSGETLVGDRADCCWLGWSADGSVLAYTRTVEDDLEFDLIDTAGKVKPLKSYPGLSGLATEITWLPDGSGLAFYEQEVGGFTITVVVLSTSGTEVARFEQPDGVPNLIIVSPDGSSLAWGIQGTSDVRIQPIAGGDARTFTVGSNAAIA
jgi:Tol biopolymer transport system component